MNAAQALERARGAGVNVKISGDRLLLTAAAPPPASMLALLASHKAEILKLLCPSHISETFQSIDQGADMGAVLAKIEEMPTPAIGAERWRGIVAGARDFVRIWGNRPIELGWSRADLAGVHPVAPWARFDCLGLVLFLGNDAKVVALTDRSAVIERVSGARLTYYRPRHCTEAVPVWVLPTTGGRDADPRGCWLEQATAAT